MSEAKLPEQAMRRCGGDVRLVEAGEPRRLPWAVTEFAIAMAEA